VTGGWSKLHTEELHNLYSSPHTITMIDSRRIRWTGHVARMGRRGMHIGHISLVRPRYRFVDNIKMHLRKGGWAWYELD
jgi:hypothetical protein